MSKLPARRRIFVDPPIQGVLISRVALYWLICMLIQVLLVMLLSVGSGMTDELYQRTHVRLVVVSSLFTLPLLMLDITKLSHRWVGPIYRLRTAMQALATGEAVQPITFRKGDFWPELASDFNAVLRRVNHLDDSDDEAGSADVTKIASESPNDGCKPVGSAI